MDGEGRSGRDDFMWLWPFPGIFGNISDTWTQLRSVDLGSDSDGSVTRSDPEGSDRTCQTYLIRELVAPRIAGCVRIV